MELNICIVDDDLVSQFATRYSIEQIGNACKICSYDSAEECLKMLIDRTAKNEKIPEILVLDLVMPGMDGWELLETIENMFHIGNELEVYVLSAFNNSKDRDRAKNHPLIKGYFDKPISKDNLEKIFHSRSD